jgi:hypothetical protein
VRLITSATAAEFDGLAAEFWTRQLKAKPAAAVALPAGSTPLGLYARLRAHAAADRGRLDEARFFDLDEYVALSAEDSLSFAHIVDVFWPATSLYDHPALTVLCAPEVIASESVREAMRRSRAHAKSS